MLRVQPWIIILGITCNTAFQKLSFKTVSSSRFCGTFNLVLKRLQSKSGICYLQNAKLDLIFQEMLPFVRCVEIGVNLVAVTSVFLRTSIFRPWQDLIMSPFYNLFCSRGEGARAWNTSKVSFWVDKTLCVQLSLLDLMKTFTNFRELQKQAEQTSKDKRVLVSYSHFFCHTIILVLPCLGMFCSRSSHLI